MSHIATPGMDNLMRIESLIANNLTNILQKENDNVSKINLYSIGDYWVAFGYSAPLDKESFSTWYRDLTMEVN